MSKEMSVIALGILVIVTTQLGIPGSWRTLLFVLAGLGIVVVGFLLRAEALSRNTRRTPHHPFIENGASAVPDITITHEQKSGITSLN